MAIAVAEAAAAAGLRIVLLPAAYHRGGHPRFRDPSVDAFLERVDALRRAPATPVGVAAHSVRAVPADWLREIAAYADAARARPPRPRPRAAARARGVPGRARLLADRAAGPHRVPLRPHDGRARDPRRRARRRRCWPTSGAIVATCPTTEGNLGDGHFPALVYRDAGVRLAIGSDSNVVVDPFEEVRELETGARRERRTRHALLAAAGDLWGALCRERAAPASGSPTPATVTVDLDHPRLRGVPDDDVMRALATCATADVVRLRP